MGFPLHHSVWLGSGGPWEVRQPEGSQSTRGLTDKQRRGDSFLLPSPFGDQSCFLPAGSPFLSRQLAGLEGKWTLYFSEDSGRLPASSAKGLNAPACTSGSQAEGRSPGGEGPGLARS